MTIIAVIMHLNRTERRTCLTMEEAVMCCFAALDEPPAWPAGIEVDGRRVWASSTAYDTRRSLYQFRQEARSAAAKDHGSIRGAHGASGEG